MAIQSFKDKKAEMVFQRRQPKGFKAPLRQTQLKLRMLHAASKLDDLRSPPGNRLEKLEGNRKGQHSIRINGQWRICFVWADSGPENVEVVDYH